MILSQALAAAPGSADILPRWPGDAFGRRLRRGGGEVPASAGSAPDDAMTRADLGACQLEMGARDAGEFGRCGAATRGRPEMLAARSSVAATSTAALLSASAAVKFLGS